MALSLVRDLRLPASAALRGELAAACGILGLRCRITEAEAELGEPLNLREAALPEQAAAMRALLYRRLGASVQRAAAATAGSRPLLRVLLLPQLVPADAAAAAALTELEGLGLPADHEALAGLKGDDRGGAVLLDATRLAQNDHSRRVALIAHELGHALGLGHPTPARQGAVMAAVGTCAGGLDAAEAEQARRAIDHAAGAGAR